MDLRSGNKNKKSKRHGGFRLPLKAFSLAETLLVLFIISLVTLSMMPIFTKRKSSFEAAFAAATDGYPLGSVVAYTGTAPPTGWLKCDGATYNNTDAPDLAKLLAPDDKSVFYIDSGHFKVPDLTGRVPVGLDGGKSVITSGGASALFKIGGEETHVLTTSEIPAHTHTTDSQGTHTHTTDVQGNHNHGYPNSWLSGLSYGLSATGSGGVDWAWMSGAGAHSHTALAAGAHTHSVLANVGGGGAHNNMPPYITMNYIIKYKYVPPPSSGGGTGSSSSGDLHVTGNLIVDGTSSLVGNVTDGGTTTLTGKTTVNDVNSGKLIMDGNHNVGLGGGISLTSDHGTAIGDSASANFASSTALGSGATATAANQIMLGTANEKTDTLNEIRVRQIGPSGYGQFRAVAGNYGSFIRNDGTSTFFLLTASGDQYGSWNSLRPFSFNDSTGVVTMSNGVWVQGGLTSIGTGNFSTIIGSGAAAGGTNSVAIGVNASAPATGVSDQVAIGTAANSSMTSAVAIGSSASVSQTARAAGYNPYSATGVGFYNSSALSGIAIGPHAYANAGVFADEYDEGMFNYYNSSCIAIGDSASAVGYWNLAIGDNARTGPGTFWAVSVGPNSYSSTESCALGPGSYSASAGTAVGLQAYASGNSSTAVGFGAVASGIGSTAIGAGASTSTANQVMIGSISNTSVKYYGALGQMSDRRLKNVKGKFVGGLNEIRKIQPYNYAYKKTPNSPRVGIIAQDLKKILPGAVTKEGDGYFSAREEDMFYSMINSIKELDKMVQGLIKDVKSLVAHVKQIDDKIVALFKEDQLTNKKIKSLESENKKLEARLKKLEKAKR